MKKILITGAGGFIGSHLSELCVSQGYDVRAFVHYNSNSNWGWLEESALKNKMEIVSGDIRDYDSVFNAARGCDAIFHLGALIGIPYSYVSPTAYVKTNIEGTCNVLQAARELNTQKVLVTSTSETYGSAQYVPIDEKHPNVGQSPYSATKIAADQMSISFFRSFNLPVTIVRPFNVYGPRQSARAIIPTILSQLLNGRQPKLGNLTPTRDLTFVEDTARGFLEIAKAPNTNGEVINIGMGEEISIGDLAHKIAQLLNMPLEIQADEIRFRPEKSEVERLHCDNRKIKSVTAWSPQFNLNSGLIKTIEWFKRNPHRYKAEMYIV